MNAIPVQTGTTISEQDDAISRALVNARLSARALAEYPGRLPDTLEQAYGIQSASIERWPDELAGWKVAKLAPNSRTRFGVNGLPGQYSSRRSTVPNSAQA